MLKPFDSVCSKRATAIPKKTMQCPSYSKPNYPATGLPSFTELHFRNRITQFPATTTYTRRHPSTRIHTCACKDKDHACRKRGIRRPCPTSQSAMLEIQIRDRQNNLAPVSSMVPWKPLNEASSIDLPSNFWSCRLLDKVSVVVSKCEYYNFS